MKRFKRAMSAFLIMVLAIGFLPTISLPVVAADYLNNPNWIETTPDEVDRMFYNNESFVVMYYGTNCYNSNLRKALVLSWLQDYGIKIYGINNEIHSMNRWAWDRIAGLSVQTPIFVVVKNSSQFDVFPYDPYFLPLQQSLFDFFGVEIKPVFDFYAINKATYNGYTSNSTYARGNFLPSVHQVDVSIKSMADEITAGLSGDYSKLRAIHDWVSRNISYDYVLQQTGVGYVDAVNVLKYRKSVCEGYSNLTAAMCHAVGIPCRVVVGMVLDGGLTDQNLSRFMSLYEEYQRKGLTQDMLDSLATITNHAWNEAFVDNRWVILDTTYDNVHGSKYFDPTLEIFSTTHFFCRGDKYYTSLDSGTAPVITTTSLPSGTVGTSYMASLSASHRKSVV